MSDLIRPAIGISTLAQVCQRLGVAEPAWKDDKYELVDMDWFVRSAVNSIYKRLCRDVGEYTEGRSDCDDFATCAREEVKRLYRNLPEKLDGCAIAFGCFYTWKYDFTPPKSHAINALFFWQGPKSEIENIVLAFWEPQRCRFDYLTTQQITTGVMEI